MSFVFDVKIQFFATRSGINFGRGKETHVDHNWSESKKRRNGPNIIEMHFEGVKRPYRNDSYVRKT